MPAAISISIKESLEELKATHSKVSVHLRARLKMLIAMVKGTTAGCNLAAKAGLSAQSVRVSGTTSTAQVGGLDALITEGRGGHKRWGITDAQKQKIASKLSNPKDALRSYKEAQAWLKSALGIEKKRSTMPSSKYLKPNFGTKLKVGRKSHLKKDEAAIVVFKNLPAELEHIKY